jgi:DNA-binding NarL/FixJ family response regulator
MFPALMKNQRSPITLKTRRDMKTRSKKAIVKPARRAKESGRTQRRPVQESRIKLLIVDDHGVIRRGLAAMMTDEDDLEVVAEAATGREAVELWQKHKPDVSLLDMRMPELDGIGAIKEIRANAPNARIVIFSVFERDEDIYLAMRAGAKAYLLKESPNELIIECIRKVHEGQTYIPAALAAKLAGRVGEETLSDRETEVLRLIARGKSNKEIGTLLFICEGTVKSHLKSIFAKLKATNRTEAVATASRRGLIQLE